MGTLKNTRKKAKRDFWHGLTAELAAKLGRLPTKAEIQNVKDNMEDLWKKRQEKNNAEQHDEV